MNCDQAKEAFGDLLGRSLQATERDEIEAHLRSCPGCRAEFEELQHVWEEFGELPSYPAPEGLEDRLEALSASFGESFPGVFKGARRRQALLQLAAAILLLTAGIFIGHRLQPSGGGGPPEGTPAGHLPRYLLLLREGAASGSTDSQYEQLVEEYGAWYRSLAARGEALQGERLHEERRLLVRTDGGVSQLGAQAFSDRDDPVSGYFLVQAESLSEALAIASGCPHLKVGTIEVRALYPE